MGLRSHSMAMRYSMDSGVRIEAYNRDLIKSRLICRVFLRTVTKTITSEHSQGKKIPRLQKCSLGVFLSEKVFPHIRISESFAVQ